MLKRIAIKFITLLVLASMVLSCNAGTANNKITTSNQTIGLSPSAFITEALNLATYFGNDELKLLFSSMQLIPFFPDDTGAQLKLINDSLNKIQATLDSMQISMNNIQQIVNNIYQAQLETLLQSINYNIYSIELINNKYNNLLQGNDIDKYIKSGESSGKIYSALQNIGRTYVNNKTLSESGFGSILQQVTEHLHQKVYTASMPTDIIGLARENNLILLGLGQNILITLETSRSLELTALYYNHYYAKDGNLIILGEDITCNGFGNEDSYKSCIDKINNIFDAREKNVALFLNQQQETFNSLDNNAAIVKFPKGSWSDSCSKDINNNPDFYFDGNVLQDSCYLADGQNTFTMPISVGICQNNIIENHNGYLSCQTFNDMVNNWSNFDIGIGDADHDESWHIFLKESETPILDDTLSLVSGDLVKVDYNNYKTFITQKKIWRNLKSIIFDAKTKHYFYIDVSKYPGDTFVTIGCIQGDPYCSVLPGSDDHSYAKIKFNEVANTRFSDVSYRIDGGGFPIFKHVGVLHRLPIGG